MTVYVYIILYKTLKFELRDFFHQNQIMVMYYDKVYMLKFYNYCTSHLNSDPESGYFTGVCQGNLTM